MISKNYREPQTFAEVVKCVDLLQQGKLSIDTFAEINKNVPTNVVELAEFWVSQKEEKSHENTK